MLAGAGTTPQVLAFFAVVVGWGGVMIRFLELANMVDATQDVGWGGLMIAFLGLANRVDTTQDVGWGGWGDDHVLSTCQHG